MVRRPATTPTPLRTCVGCRRRAPATELLRVVAPGVDPGSVHGPWVLLVPDPRRRRPGRGANLHPDQECLALAERRRAFGRALRLTGTVDVTALREYVLSLPGEGRAQVVSPG